MLGPVTAQVIHVGVDIAQRDRPGQVQIHVVNRNFIQLGGTRRFAFFNLHIAEEVAQIQVVFIHRFSGVTLNGLMIHQKVPQNRRSSQTVVICIQILPPTQQNFYFVELEIYPLSIGVIPVSLIACTSACVYQQDGYCRLERASSYGVPCAESPCVNFVPRRNCGTTAPPTKARPAPRGCCEPE